VHLFRLLGGLLGAAVVTLATLAGQTASTDTTSVDVHILAINDFHGALEAVDGGNGRLGAQTAGGAEYLAAHLARLRAEHANTVVVSAGDNVGGTPLLSSLSHHESSIEAMNLAGLQVSTVGNHELDQGWWELLRLMKGGCHPVDGCQDGTPFNGAAFDYLAANVVLDPSRADPKRLAEAGATGTAPRPLVPGSVIKSVGGVRVGFIGLLPVAARNMVQPESVKGLVFTPLVEAANAAARELRQQGAAVVVALTHEGGFTARGDVNACERLTPDFVDVVTRMSDEIDVVVSGHTHWAYTCTVGTKLVTSASSSGRVVTDIDLRVSRATGRVTAKSARNVVVTRDVPPDAAVSQLLAHYRPVAEKLGGRVVGTVGASLTRAPNAAGELAFGGVVADAFLEAAAKVPGGEAAFAVTNPWGIRADLVKRPAPGGSDVSYAELFEVLPFGNIVIVKTLTGAAIVDMLEDQFDGDTTRVMQVSRGFTYAYAASGPRRGRVDRSSIRINGAPLDLSRRYRVASLDFLWDTGDGMRALATGTDPVTIGLALDALADYFAAHSPVMPTPQDRIRRVGP